MVEASGRARLTLVGEVALHRADGALVKLPGRCGGALLAYLALEADRAHDRAALAALLWPRTDRPSARAALRQTLFALRRRFEEAGVAAALVVDGASVRFDPAPVDVDVDAISAAAETPGGEAMRAYVHGWGSPLLAGLAPLGPAHDRWIETKRAAFADRTSRALAALLDRDLGRERWREALATAKALLRADPTSEEAALGARRALQAIGDPIEAAAVDRASRAYGSRDDAYATPWALPGRADRLLTSSPARPPAAVAEATAREADRRPALLMVARVDPAAPRACRREALERVAARAAGDGGLLIRREPDHAAAVFGEGALGAEDVTRALELALELATTGAGPPAELSVALVAGAMLTADDGAPWVAADDLGRAIALATRGGPGTASAEDAVRHMAGAERAAFEVTGDPDRWRIAPLAAPELGRHPFVGRVSEAAQLRALLEATRAGGLSHVARLIGEPGIGKTRLAREMLKSARALGCETFDVVLRAGEIAIEGQLLWRIGKIVAPGRPDTDAADQGTPPGERALLRQNAVAAAIRARAGDRPLAILLDQLENVAVAETFELAGLLRALADAPVFWLLAGRPVDGERDLLAARLRGRLPLTAIALAPLPPADAARLAARFSVGAAERSGALDRAGGNPLFLEQLLLHLSESRGEAPPHSVIAAVLARLASLDPLERSVLRAIAVLGPEVPGPVVERLTGAGAQAIAALQARDFLREHGGRLSFAHPLIGECILETMTPEARCALHARAAEATRDPVRRAHHLGAAGDARAAAAVLDAARTRHVEGRHAEAIALAQRGLALPRRAALTAALLLVLGRAHLDLGDLDDALDAFERTASAAIDRETRAHGLIACASAHRVLDRLDRGLAALETAERLLGDNADALCAELELQRGRLLYARGDAAGSAAAHERALARATAAGDVERSGLALGGLADAAYATGRMESAAGYLARSIASCEVAGNARFASAQRALAPHLEVYRGDVRRGLVLAREAAEEAARLGAWRAEINARLGVAAAAFLLDLGEECRGAAETVLGLVERSGARRFGSVALLYLARIELSAERTDCARRLAERALESAEATGRAVYAAQAVALLAATTDREGEAFRLLDEACTIIDAGAVSHNALRVYPNAAWTALRFGDTAAALAYARRLAAVAPAQECRWASLYVSAITALVDDDREERRRQSGDANAAGYLPLARLLAGDLLQGRIIA